MVTSLKKGHSCCHEDTMVIFTDKQVDTMVEDTRGETARTTFEDIECGPDPMHPINNGCSSIKDDDRSDDNKTKERYVDQAQP